MAKIGDLYEIAGEITFEWRIKDFSKLSEEINIRYESPKFYFSGTSWVIWIYPNGETEGECEGYIGIYVIRMSTGFPLFLNYSLNLKIADGKTHQTGVTGTEMFKLKQRGWGASQVMLRSTLTERKSELTPSDTLTIICTLNNTQLQGVAGSLFSRQQEICDNLKEIYEKAKRTDFILKVDGEDIPAHRMVLETRSPVFAAMFNHDTKENQTGEVSIDDMEISTVKVILEHMYCGDIKRLTTQNALPIYAAADKYDIKDVKEICLDFIKNNLSVEWVCDVIKFADLYHEEEIGCCAREYFKENARKILDTENWKTFAKENHNTGVELLGCVIKALIPE